MADKTNKLKARLPRGLADRGPAEIAATRRMTDAIRDVYERYGFEPVETPAIEYTDALGKFLPDQDRPNEGVFSFQDDDEQWLSLRYDLTAPLARYVAENFDALPKPYRSYRFGWVFRNEKPGPGRFRQFMQFDADTVGSASPAADAEICMMAADTMEALGLKGQYVVKVNNRKVLDGVLEAIGLGGEANAGKRLTVLRAIDKLDRLGAGGVNQLLGEGRKDESGDFTKGAGLDAGAIDRVLSFVELKGANAEATLANLAKVVAGSTQGEAGVDELRQISSLTTSSDYGDDRILIDPSVVRGLEYYTGPVYEVELLLETKDEKGRPVRFGSVGGGGRYDGLVSRFRGEPVPATGFSIGVSRLQAALTMIGKLDGKAGARPGGGDGVRPRPHRRLPEDGRCAAQRRHPRRALSREPEEFRQSVQVRRQARQPLRGDPGRRREGQRRSADQGLDPRRRDRRVVEGTRRLPEEAGGSAIRRAGDRPGRRGAQGARPPRHPLELSNKFFFDDC